MSEAPFHDAFDGVNDWLGFLVGVFVIVHNCIVVPPVGIEPTFTG